MDDFPAPTYEIQGEEKLYDSARKFPKICLPLLEHLR